jgi:hypothetical protein
MSSKVLWILGIFIMFFLGMGIAFVFENSQNVPPVSGVPVASSADGNLSKTISILNSGIVDMVARGSVESIAGRDITLNRGGTEKVAIKVAANAKIVSLQVPKDQNSPLEEKQADFSQIKKGDSIEIVLKIQSDQSVLGQTVYIYPPVPAKK